MSVKKRKGLDTDPAQEDTPSEAGLEGPPEPATPGESPAEATAGPQGPASEATVETGVASLEKKIAELEGALAESREQLLRRVADFDNTRKRLQRDKEESVKYANTALLTDLVDAIDGLERAIQSTESSRDFDSLHQGVVLIEKQLMGSLERKWGLSRMSAKGQPFDPTLHQAVSMGAASEGPVQVVLEEFQSGYILNGRVLRPARVVVSAPPGTAGAQASAAPAAEGT